LKSIKIVVKGQVQGLGFRPYVYRLAKELGLAGTVRNSRDGVEIIVEGDKTDEFASTLRKAPPALARITSLVISSVPAAKREGFTIITSKPNRTTPDARRPTPDGKRSAPGLDVLPDIATCPECLVDISDPGNRRHHYPFTNCTQCGPRYSIVESLPYDRPRTTMKGFRMCPDCHAEYQNPADRRFHAQPNCCPVCGPKVKLLHADGSDSDARDPIGAAIRFLLDGRIIAVKGIGGYHIACDATNPAAVAELRRRKDRPDKPFAVMCPDIDAARRYAEIDDDSMELLLSPARPIVLLPKRQKTQERRRKRRSAMQDANLQFAMTPGVPGNLAPGVAPGLNHVGIMLPYAPLQHLLFQSPEKVEADADDGRRTTDDGTLDALVMTSANLRDEPVIGTIEEIQARLPQVVEYVLDHNRPIANRCDDSVVQHSDQVDKWPSDRVKTPGHSTTRPLDHYFFVRRARGYAPVPVILDAGPNSMKPVLACGGEQKNTFALATGNKVYLSPHIGDLNSASGMEFFTQTLDRYRRWYDIRLEAVACDRHPDYLSTRYAENLATKSHRPLVRVQHHHAHIASVMAEHGLTEPVLGIALDGTGLGTDERIWGCELLLAWRARFERLGHLRYLPLLGGEASILEPQRTADGYLDYLFAGNPNDKGRRTKDEGRTFQIRDSTFEIPSVIFTSSTGRLFDAVSALLGICPRASYDGQAPALLEAAADAGETGSYFEAGDIAPDSTGTSIINPESWLRRILDDLQTGVPKERVSRLFHNTFIAALVAAATPMARRHHIKSICLSGGSFQNRILLNGLTGALANAGYAVYANHQVPLNDGGLALGQAVVAAAQLRKGSRKKGEG
jgi:hydrogenase maturation protein HypF